MSGVLSQSVSSSALSRHSADVFAAADRGAVEITRRDGESLILTRKSELERQYTILNLAADLVAASLGGDGTTFVDRLQDRFPWMRFLTPAERESFVDEIVESARSCAAVRDFTPFLVDLSEWRATAQAKAAGYTADADLEWLSEPREVADPRLS